MNWAILVAASIACCILLAGCDAAAPSDFGSKDEVEVQGAARIGGVPASEEPIASDPPSVKHML